ncbi:MAG: phenylacetic acid degradation protein [Chloroflexota bacterium]
MWPRWEVFKKDNARKPYQAVGSVHAVDPEHALLNAKNVFVRRPSAVSLWVAPASAIFAKTAQELAQEPLNPQSHVGNIMTFQIFRKSSHSRSMTFVDHVGEVSAADPESALVQAIETFNNKPGLGWWVIPADAIFASEDGVEDGWFEPAKTKTYRSQAEYGFKEKKARKAEKISRAKKQ